MANYVLTTTAQEVGRNTTPVVGARLLAWYTNAGSNSAMVHLKLQAIAQGGTYTGTNKDYQLVLDSTDTGTVAWSYAPLTADTWIDVREITQYVNYGAKVNVSGKVWTYLHGDAWVTGNTVTLQSSATPPTGLAIANLTPGVDSFTADVSITGWGTGAGSDKYLELQCWTIGMVQPRRYQTDRSGELSANITVDNNSGYSTASGPLTIVGNTEYTIGAYATNGNANTGSVNMGNSTTLAYNPTISVAIDNGSSVTVDYTTLADGGKYSKTYEYSIDGGTTWTTFATVSGGSASSGSFNISGLTQGVRYTLQTRVTTTAGTNTAQTYFIIPAVIKTYGSVNNVAAEINDLYGSANSQAQRITKLYGSSNGVSTLIHQGFGHLNYGP